MKKSENIILYILLGLILIILVFSLSTLFNKDYSQEQYNTFVSAELEDKCKTPSDYTDQEWIEHMSHHPDRYKECLN
ncbi:MAG: hypothetical protein AABX55_01545 [Nanoarchaeota archaeon]